jgi:hypothetical protein
MGYTTSLAQMSLSVENKELVTYFRPLSPKKS